MVCGIVQWSAGFRDLRAPLEGVQRRAALRLRFGLLVLDGLPCLGGQPQLEQIPRRHGVLPADHHDVAEHVLERLRELGAARGRTADHPAKEPARSVHSDEPDQLAGTAGVRRVSRHVRVQLGAKRAAGLLALTSASGELVGYLAPHVVPQPTPLGRGERLHLEAAFPPYDRDPGSLVLGYEELDLVPRTDGNADTAEVNPLILRVGVAGIPWAAGLPGGLALALAQRVARLVRRVPVIISHRLWLVCLWLIRALRATPTEHSARSLSPRHARPWTRTRPRRARTLEAPAPRGTPRTPHAG